MRMILLVLTSLAAFTATAAQRAPDFATGRSYYEEGNFKKAAAYFELALKLDPEDADACYWTGMAYQRLADIATPFGGRYTAKARKYLAKAVLLAPSRSDYRLELFNHLLDSADAAQTRPPRVTAALVSVSESDPEYAEMRRRLDSANKAGLSSGAVLTRLFLTAPRAAYDLTSIRASTALRLITPIEW